MSSATSTRERRRVDVWAALAGLACLAVGMVVVRHGSVPGWERRGFRAVNDLPGALYPVLWPFQQVGAVLVGPLVAVVALATGRRRLAAAAAVVTMAKLVSERAVKAVVSRDRPARSIGGDLHLRGDVEVTGESFVSGHAVLVAALAVVVAPYLPTRWRPVLWGLVVVVAVARVYVGAHNPLDVVCGAGLGVALGSATNLAFGVPVQRDRS